jgi:hypothetical protein
MALLAAGRPCSSGVGSRHLSRRDLDDELGELGRVAGAFRVFVGHGTYVVAWLCNGSPY